MEKFVGYYRVSTKTQGESGLGLADQKMIVNTFVKGKGELLAEFEDVETSRNDNRKGLLQALELCKKEGAILVIGKMDRLLRKLSLLVALRASKIKFLDASSPYATDLEINMRVVFAEEELRKISERVEAGLNQIKISIETKGYHISKKGNKITSLGSPSNNITLETRNKAYEAIKSKAESNENNKRAKAVIKLLKEKGMTLEKIAQELNVTGFKTSRGGEFGKMQVKRLLN